VLGVRLALVVGPSQAVAGEIEAISVVHEAVESAPWMTFDLKERLTRSSAFKRR